MSLEGRGPPEGSRLCWLLASQEAPVAVLFLPLSVSCPSHWWYSSASLPHPLAPCFSLSPSGERALQPPCFRSPKPVAFIIPVSLLFISMAFHPTPLALQTPSSGWGFLLAAGFSGRDAAMPWELKPMALQHGTGARVACGQPAQ